LDLPPPGGGRETMKFAQFKGEIAVPESIQVLPAFEELKETMEGVTWLNSDDVYVENKITT